MSKVINKRLLNAVLLLYHHPLRLGAPTVMEYVNAFGEHSRFPILAINTELGLPAFLRNYRFKCILMHYSIFGTWPYEFNEQFYEYLTDSRESYKVAIFQDEYRYCQPRFHFINKYNIDCVYTCLAEKDIADFYGKYTRASRVISVLTGYVSEKMLALAHRFALPDEQRRIDIGYRGRPLPFYMGKGAQEKVQIAEGFLARAASLDLNLDIKTTEADRIYGPAWYEYLANCRGVLGVESGVSFCDVEDRAKPEVEALLLANPAVTFDEVYEKVLVKYEDHIPIRTISPRHFEAAALRVCQILFEGEYGGILKPMLHYIPLKKDFSNFDEVIAAFTSPEIRNRITQTAYQDLIASGKYSYRTLVGHFDDLMLEAGLTPGEDRAIMAKLQARYTEEQKWRTILKTTGDGIRYSAFIQKRIKPLVRPIMIKAGIIRPEAK
jgi:hypothetical protein